MIQYIEGKMLRDMFVSGANNLQNHKELVDKLNVFPVPDGDTGTNMSLTISYAMKELAKVENDSITEIGKSLSKGSLMGARGNSGVILPFQCSLNPVDPYMIIQPSVKPPKIYSL